MQKNMFFHKFYETTIMQGHIMCHLRDLHMMYTLAQSIKASFHFTTLKQGKDLNMPHQLHVHANYIVRLLQPEWKLALM